MNRPKTDSITHLVKIVAREVYLEEKKLEAKETKVYSFDTARVEKEVVNTLLGNITSTLYKSGKVWPKEEDWLLIQEVKTAIKQIAQNHERSKGAIAARILNKYIIEGEQ